MTGGQRAHARPERAQIARVASELRAFQEPLWRDWKAEKRRDATILSDGMCRFATAFLWLALPARGLACLDARPQQGCAQFHPADPGVLTRLRDTPGGFRAPDGVWHDHLWLLVTAREGPTIVDVTADQFADAPVIVTDPADPRYRCNWRASLTRRHLQDVMPRARGWLDRLTAASG